MSGIPILYGYEASTYTRMVLVAADEKEIEYKFQRVAPWDGYTKDPKYVGLHPFLKVPVLKHGNVKITEAIAIMNYLEAAFDGPSLVPNEPVALARMWEIISTTISYGWPVWVPILATHRLFNPIAGDDVDENLISDRLPDMCRAVAIIGKYLAIRENTFDLADIVVAGAFKYVTETPECEEIMQSSSAFSDWWERTSSRPSVAKHMPDTDWALRGVEMASRKEAI
jgi:glutathione S-transferase